MLQWELCFLIKWCSKAALNNVLTITVFAWMGKKKEDLVISDGIFLLVWLECYSVKCGSIECFNRSIENIFIWNSGLWVFIPPQSQNSSVIAQNIRDGSTLIIKPIHQRKHFLCRFQHRKDNVCYMLENMICIMYAHIWFMFIKALPILLFFLWPFLEVVIMLVIVTGMIIIDHQKSLLLLLSSYTRIYILVYNHTHIHMCVTIRTRAIEASYSHN